VFAYRRGGIGGFPHIHLFLSPRSYWGGGGGPVRGVRVVGGRVGGGPGEGRESGVCGWEGKRLGGVAWCGPLCKCGCELFHVAGLRLRVACRRCCHSACCVQPIGESSGADAVGNFLGILIGSTIIGIMFGLFVTFVFKYFHIANSESNGVQETAVLLLFAYGSYVFGTQALRAVVGGPYPGLLQRCAVFTREPPPSTTSLRG
jgi:hypothetical protein